MSERLTVKYDDGSYGIFSCDNRVEDKLGKIEDIEEELGIDLITLFKAFNGINYVKNGEIKFSCHIAIVDYCIYILDESLIFDSSKSFCVDIKDYGKTWALPREEIEK